MIARAVGALVALWVYWPSVVLACPVCSPERDDAARQAFFDTTVFLTLLPLAMLGLAVTWLVRRARRLELQEERELSGHRGEA